MVMLALLVVSWLFAAVEANASSDPSEKIMQLVKQFLPKLCPATDICLGNDTTTGAPGKQFEPDEISCCTDCSCDPDCSKNGNCCFANNIPSEPEIKQPESSCLFPKIPQPQEPNLIHYQSYRMISNVPKSSVTDNNSVPVVKCGDENVAPWGSFLPVFSKTTAKIYKNSACSQAAGVTDGVIWQVQLSCKYLNAALETNDAASFISALYMKSLPDYCQLQFIYPGNISDLKSHTCFEDLISTCPKLNFEIPMEFQQLSKGKIRKACTSGLISPYRKSEMFANVFCHICNGEYFASKFTCRNIYGARGGSNGRFVGLIDGETISKIKLKSEKEPYFPQACYIDGKKEPDLCRPVFCPSGQIRDSSGKCIFITKKWFTPSYTIYITLTADEYFDINDTVGFSSLKSSYITPLRHKWPKHWYIDAVSYELVNEHRNKCNTLFVQVTNVLPISDPIRVLKNIRFLLTLPWVLEFKDKNLISMSADLFHVSAPFHVDLLQPRVGLEVKDENISVPKYVYLYKDHNVHRKKPFVVTRLYFCEQVELNATEFEMHAANAVMWNKLTNRTFLTGEFTTLQSTSFSGIPQAVLVRICLSDSGFTRTGESSAVCACINRILVLTWTCTVFIWSYLEI